MHIITRRNFLTCTATAGLLSSTLLGQLLAAKEEAPWIRVGLCDWSFSGRANPDVLDAARRIKLDGVEISPKSSSDTLSYADPEVQKKYKDKVKETGVIISSLGMLITNKCPLATDPRGPAWLEQTIDATHSFGAKVILMAFFGKGELRKKSKGKKKKKGKDKRGPRKLDMKLVDPLVERLKKAAPLAKEKGVILGLENTLSAEQNVKIMDAVGHESVQVYYDIANSTKNGYDVPAEIRMLGNRICQFHFKDNKGKFDSGNPAMGPIIEAVKAIKYKGWIIIERAFGKKPEEKEAYFAHNARFVRNAFGLKEPDYR